MKNINKKKFFEYIKKKKELLLVDFWAKWCFPCKEMNKILKNIEKKFKNKKIIILKINIDKHIDLADKYNIQSIPTIFFFKKEKILKTIIGTINYKYLKKKIKKLL
ncbi:MAG: thioredoxin domain-containing protein [Candidatus Shikimatogenerans sp. Tcar]|uniref:Thioredoxin n=1 Tax=Candidatus Shikimatogenerans sp. Tcar TaxID=3158565 RepID=A0AAU7QT18_9FLAO